MKLRERILYHIYYCFFKAMARLPLWGLYFTSSFLAWVLRDVVKYRRNVVRENLRNSFPEMSDEERLDIEKRFYQHFCDTVVETVKLLHMKNREVHRRIEIVDYELVNQSNREGRSVVLFLGHYGNWEWVMRISDYFNTPGVALGHIYKPLHDRAFDRLMKRVRSRFATRGVPMEQAYRHHLDLHSKGKLYVTGFISDQRPTDAPAHFETTFLNQPTRFTPGAERIGKRTGADFYYVDVERKSRGHYRITFKPMVIEEEGVAQERKDATENGRKGEDNPYTRLYFRMLEQTIRRDPALWLWSHRRWLKE